ncbi:hypothetical protein [Tropicimonas sp.]|uniref:hypothetical protein n=1 Tax=Tropicimonas sp. TaxID=2067044 RepID=UPI003A87FCE7
MENRRTGSPVGVVALMMALTGALFFFAFMADDARQMRADGMVALPWGLMWRYLLAMAAGGGLTGAALAGAFGRGGAGGWLLALLAGIAATLIAGLVGSTVGMLPDLLADGWQGRDLIPVAAGLLVVPFALAGEIRVFGAWLPGIWLLPVWLALICLTHLWARRLRER